LHSACTPLCRLWALLYVIRVSPLVPCALRKLYPKSVSYAQLPIPCPSISDSMARHKRCLAVLKPLCWMHIGILFVLDVDALCLYCMHPSNDARCFLNTVLHVVACTFQQSHHMVLHQCDIPQLPALPTCRREGNLQLGR
jgi:hypothetical protein